MRWSKTKKITQETELPIAWIRMYPNAFLKLIKPELLELAPQRFSFHPHDMRHIEKQDAPLVVPHRRLRNGEIVNLKPSCIFFPFPRERNVQLSAAIFHPHIPPPPQIGKCIMYTPPFARVFESPLPEKMLHHIANEIRRLTRHDHQSCHGHRSQDLLRSDPLRVLPTSTSSFTPYTLLAHIDTSPSLINRFVSVFCHGKILTQIIKTTQEIKIPCSPGETRCGYLLA